MVAVIFDVDGTLIYSEKLDSRSFADTYEELYKKTFPTIDWHLYPHVTDDTIFSTVIKEHFEREVEQEEISVFQELYIEKLKESRAKMPNQYLEVPGAKRFFDQLLQNDNFEIGIATGGWKRPQEVKLAHVGIQTDQIPFSGADGKQTREDIIEDAMQQLSKSKAEYERIVYLGDAIWDIRTTRNLQMNFVGIRHRMDTHILHQAGAQHVLTGFEDTGKALEAIWMATPPSMV